MFVIKSWCVLSSMIFLADIYSRYQDNEKLQSIVDKSNYKVDLDFINYYEESVQKCLTTDVGNNAFIII